MALMVAVIVLILVLGAAFIGIQLLSPILSMTGQTVPRTADDAATTAGTASADLPGGAAQLNRAAATPGLSRQGRVNVLLLGSDNDSKFESGKLLTQSMIVVSIDSASRTVGMLSIPRDLWVSIPGYGFGKIDVAYEVGGVELSRRTIEQDFGIPIHYYAWVGLDGFMKVVDELGGVSVDVTHPVVDDAYPDDVSGADKYAYMHLYVPAGPQHLNGYEALQYVRSRHGDLVGDFGRSARQQQVLLSLKRHAETPSLITKLPSMINHVKDSVRTDFSAVEIVEYANFARQIQRGQIRQLVLSPPDYSANGTSPDGTQSVVFPDWKAIDPALAQMFALATAPTAAARGEKEAVVRGPARAGTAIEPQPGIAARVGATALPAQAPAPPVAKPTLAPVPEVTVQVQNGTSVAGLGTRASLFLSNNGYRTAVPVNADRLNYQQTVVYYDPAARATALAVGRLLGASAVPQPARAGNSPAIIVVLGSDAAKRF